MWYFLISVVPKSETDFATEIGGAYVNCWINFQIEDGARHLGEFYITQRGWVIEAIEESQWVEQETYNGDADGLLYFNEALEDGACFVYNQWPTNGEDSDD